MALSSPGVQVSVIDESFYTPAEPGTVPLIIVATAQDKQNGAGTGTAPGTTLANAGKVYLMTSQKDLVDTFGDPVFKTDTNNNPIHGGEQNEYGLQAAYSLLGVSNRAFVVRADVDLDQLNASASEPTSDPVNGTYWFDVATSLFGIFEFDGSNTFTNKLPTTITNVDDTSGGLPKTSIGAIGDYAVVAVSTTVSICKKLQNGQWAVVGSDDWIADVGSPDQDLYISPHTDVPQWKGGNAAAGSVWIKTTEPNKGAKWSLKRWNTATATWDRIATTIHETPQAAIYSFDSTNGGLSIGAGTSYIKYNVSEQASDPSGAGDEATFTIYRRSSTGATSITSAKIAATFGTGSKSFQLKESLAGSASLSSWYTINFTTANTEADAEAIATAINTAAMTHVVAEVTGASGNRKLVIKHKTGGEILLKQGTGNPLTTLFSVGTTTNYFTAPSANPSGAQFVASLWAPLTYTASDSALTETATDGTLWYNSVIDEVDIMVHDGTKWTGFSTAFPAAYSGGPIVSASEPDPADYHSFVVGDLWISTADLENFPTIYRYDGSAWALVDKTDQTTDEGILFADARYSTSGETSDVAAPISELLNSDYVDPDAPDPALYPQGMLLWNLRRSGFNVKKFRRNYIDVMENNLRYSNESMIDYYPHRWVTESANQVDGSGTFGRKSQRAVVVQALQSTVNSNQDLRDEEGRVFNLIACPGYPELIGEMVTLNYDRGLTAFVVGDSPARLPSDATSLLAWGNNDVVAVQDDDSGLVSFDEYLGVFYPWGFSSDNFGNNVVVPPSHMMLRTIALNDQVAYPWFAPAGTRRGGISNATAVGYVTSEGEFKSVALNEGQRDTLYSVKVNPLTFLNGAGLVNYGQKTRARNASSLDRINVARLVVYLRRQLNQLAKPYIFEPNDKLTRDQIKAAVESLMLELVSQRAIYDFIVVCDDSNNTPERIDRNELYIDIAIEPVKAVEFIYIPLRLKNTGEIAALG